MKLKTTQLRSAVDQLGELKAKIADLTAQEARLKTFLKLAYPNGGALEGSFYRAAVSTSERAMLDQDAVRAKLSPQFIAAHTTYSEVTSVKISARVRDVADDSLPLFRRVG